MVSSLSFRTCVPLSMHNWADFLSCQSLYNAWDGNRHDHSSEFERVSTNAATIRHLLSFFVCDSPHLKCTALYTYIQFVGDASVVLPTLNLAIRTMAVWSTNKFIKYGLILVILGHWAVLFQGTRYRGLGSW
jgi:hypothetical protein